MKLIDSTNVLFDLSDWADATAPTTQGESNLKYDMICRFIDIIKRKPAINPLQELLDLFEKDYEESSARVERYEGREKADWECFCLQLNECIKTTKMLMEKYGDK